jgi:WD40 repeat protein
MRPWQTLFVEHPWLGVALFQATLVSGLAALLWLSARRCHPAARAAMLLAGIVGVLSVPLFGATLPVWLPLEGDVLPAVAAAEPVERVLNTSIVGPAPQELPPFPEPPPDDPYPNEAKPNAQPARSASAGDSHPSLALRAGQCSSESRSAVRAWTVAELAAVIWVVGFVVCVVRAGVGLAFLYRCSRRASPLEDPEWSAELQARAERLGLRRAVELRSCRAIGTPLTLGLWRPVILLPTDCHWTADQRVAVLGHELAHIRRGDFLAGLLAELAVCLFWFHPLVRWLAARLRLEQEFAADAWAMALQPTSHGYLHCLAQLALETNQERGALAPAFWRRRPEILRRIHMLRRHPNGPPPSLRRSTRWTLALLALGSYLTVAGVGAADKKADDAKPEARERTDIHGDALPAGAVQRLGTLRFRHNSTALAYSPDGKTLASGGRDNQIRLFDAASGKELRRLIGHQPRSYSPGNDGKGAFDALVNATGEGGVNSVAFSPDGKLLASGGWDDTVRIWDVATGKELRKLTAHKAMVGRVAFSPDGKVLASRGSLDGSVKLWDPLTGTQLQKFTGLSNINPWRFNHDSALVFAPDGKTVAATARKAIVFFDVASGAETRRLESHVYGITLAYSPDGKILASGGVDEGHDVYSLRIWDAAAGKELRKCDLPKNEPPTYLSFDPNNNGKLAAVVAEDVMHIFDVNTGKEVVPLKHYWPSRVVYAPDGKSVASAGSGPMIRHWNTATGEELYRDREGHSASVGTVAVSPDGKLVATGGGDIRLWDPATGKQVRRIEVKGGVSSLAFAPDGKSLATGGQDKIVHLWDVETGKAIGELKGHKLRIIGIAYSPDGKLIASGDAQATIRIWDVASGKDLQEIDNKTGADEGLSLAFSPDSKTLACAGAWNDTSFIPKAGTVFKINGKEVKSDGVFNIQGVTMTHKEGYFVLQWDVNTGKELRRYGGLNDKIKSVAFSPDGATIAATSKDGKVCLWDTASGEERLHILAHPQHKEAGHSTSPCVAFAPDGKTVVTASTDRTIRFWDARTAKERGRLQAGDSPLMALAIARDGKTLVTASSDTTALVWDLSLPIGVKPNGQPGLILIGD